MPTKIPYVDETWNPVVGCSPVSAGCDNAARVASRGLTERHRGLAREGYWFGRVRLVPEVLDTPQRWRKPRRVLVPSMGDLFHSDVPGEYRTAVFDTMQRAQDHTFLVLTKRMTTLRRWLAGNGSTQSPNIWLGVSVECQDTADDRLPSLRRLSGFCWRTWVSVEPLLGPVDLRFDQLMLGSYLPWIVVGGETGPGARRCDEGWIRSVVDQCRVTHVPCFVKQIGSNSDYPGPLETWPEDLQVRELDR
jgi:protein gp37